MNQLIAQAGLGDQVLCDSAGTAAYHIGKLPDQRMRAAAQRRGMNLVSRARQFQLADFTAFDLILAMDADNYGNILSQDRQGEHRHKVKMMCEFCQRYPDQEVPDPYYGGAEGFEYVLDLLADACNGLLVELTENFLAP
jgi:protein-tyrosine phosphatase